MTDTFPSSALPASTLHADDTAASLPPATAGEGETLIPIIPDAVEFKYYHVPEGFKRLRNKRKVALLFGYIGERYCGLQWNHLPEHPTVEEALLKALFETDMISLTNFSQYKVQQLLNFERASRTDKGVHALCNVVSVNVMLPYDPEYVKEEQERLRLEREATAEDATTTAPQDPSAHQRFSCAEAKRLLRLALPSDIHLYDIVPVTRSFNAYLCCGGRRYEYFLPTFALMGKNDYAQQYFPPHFALSHPNLKEVGFKPNKGRLPGPGKHDRDADVDDDEGAPCNSSGRRSKGHFPKANKQRKQQEAEKVRKEMEAREAKRKRLEDVPALVTAEEKDDIPAVLSPEEFEKFIETHCATHFHDHLFESMILFHDIPEERMRAVAKYRIPNEQLEHIRHLFHLYEGTHCYHNFTPGGRSTDASCHRYMRQITVSAPVLWKPDDPLLEASIDAWTPTRFFAPDEGVAEACEEALQALHSTLHATPPHANTASEAASPFNVVQSEAVETPALPEQPQEEESSMKRREEELEKEAVVLRQRIRQHLRDVYPEGIEVVRIELDGQSFMLNQIRKMIGAIVCIAAAGLPPSFLVDRLLKKGPHVPIPMVPANGLLLSFLDFSGYGKRLERIQQNGDNGSGKGGVDVEEIMSKEEFDQQERRTVSVILRNEMSNDLMGKWMRSVRHAVRLAWNEEIP